MRFHSLVVASSLLAALSSSGGAQTTRWNDRVALDTLGDAPAVRVWIDGTRSYAYGEAVRVRFMVEHDAYVIVARVDGNGHVTVLWPSNRSRSLEVRGGEEVAIRGRTGGSFASFYATDRVGGGYVFAMASYDPFDLSRLSIRDFDRYVTGSYVGRPSRAYIGDPYRVVSRFAAMVLYDERTPYDFDVDYYNVGSPSYQSSSGYSSLCNGFSAYGYGSRMGRLQERWDDELYYSTLGGDGYGCGRPQCFAYTTLGYLGGLSVPFCGYLNGGQHIVTGPRLPPTRADSGRVNGWLVDNIGRTRPDTVGTRPVGEARLPERPRHATDADGRVYGQTRRAPLDAENVEGGRVFSIPERALTNIRRRNARAAAEAPNLPGRPGSRSPAAGGDDGVTWVRPPQEMGRRDPSVAGEGRLPRATRREERGGRGEAGFDGGRSAFPDRPLPPRRDGGARSSEPPRFDAPSRNDGPRFQSPPPSIRERPEIRQSAPPPRAEPVRQDAPRIQVERPSAPPQPVKEPPERRP